MRRVASDGEVPLAEKKRKHPRLGKHCQLRLVRLSGGAEWDVPLTKKDVPGEKMIEKTNLFWFEWRHPLPS